MGSLISHPGPPWSIEIELLHDIVGDGFHNVSCHCGSVVMHLRCDVRLHISVSLPGSPRSIETGLLHEIGDGFTMCHVIIKG